MLYHGALKMRILCGLAVILLLLSGCSTSPDSSEVTGTDQSAESTQAVGSFNLHLTYKPDQDHFVTFEEKDLNGAFKGDLEYFQVTDVMLNIDGITLPLEDALRDGTITFHEIRYRAQQDTAAGTCYETVESKRGLTRFCYDYLSYKLYITDDIYETPDDSKHHIRKILVTTTGNKPVTIYPELDQEDWGIEFEIADVSPCGITLNYTQSGGQLIGQLRTGNYTLSRTDIVKAVLPLDDMWLPETLQIHHNSEGSITLDFENYFGALESGDYLLYLYLHDNYDPEQVPPLIRNYHDMQCYTVEFSIP